MMFCKTDCEYVKLDCKNKYNDQISVDLKKIVNEVLNRKTCRKCNLYNSICEHTSIDNLIRQFERELNLHNICSKSVFNTCSSINCLKYHFYIDGTKLNSFIKKCNICENFDQFWNKKINPYNIVTKEFNISNKNILGIIYELIIKSLKKNKDLAFNQFIEKNWVSHIDETNLNFQEIFLEETFNTLKIINRIKFWRYQRIYFDQFKLSEYDDLAKRLFDFKNFRYCSKYVSNLSKALYNNEKIVLCKKTCKHFTNGSNCDMRDLVEEKKKETVSTVAVNRIEFMNQLHTMIKYKKIYGIHKIRNLILNYHEQFDDLKLVPIRNYLFNNLNKKKIKFTPSLGAFSVYRSCSDESTSSDQEDLSLDLSIVKPVDSPKFSPRTYIEDSTKRNKRELLVLRIKHTFSKLKKNFSNIYNFLTLNGSRNEDHFISDDIIKEIVKILEFYMENKTKSFLKKTKIKSLKKYNYKTIRSFIQFKIYFQDTMYPELSDYKKYCHKFDVRRKIQIKQSNYTLRSFFKVNDADIMSGFTIKRKIPYLFDMYIKDCERNLGESQFSKWLSKDRIKWTNLIPKFLKMDDLNQRIFDRTIHSYNNSYNKSSIPKFVNISTMKKNINETSRIKVISKDIQINLSRDNFEMKIKASLITSKKILDPQKKYIMANLQDDFTNLRNDVKENDISSISSITRNREYIVIKFNSDKYDFIENKELVNKLIYNIFCNLSYYYYSNWTDYDYSLIKIIYNQSSEDDTIRKLDNLKDELKRNFCSFKKDLSKKLINDIVKNNNFSEETIRKHLDGKYMPTEYHWNTFFDSSSIDVICNYQKN